MKQPRMLQTGVLFIGTLFAWWTVVQDYLRFYNYEGTLFKIEDCIFPNPVTTPCFWGAWAFLIALVWAARIQRNALVPKTSQRNLVYFLVAGTLFAWFNNVRGLMSFYGASGAPVVGCSGQLVTNPYTTACFIGASLFLASLVVGIVTYRSMRASA
ncbi:MAG: hypothetical protein AAB490_05605 [Patescibacteria group bacterium]